MAQLPSRICPQCGTSVPANQRFCSNCGSTMDIGVNNPTAAASSGSRYADVDSMPTEAAAPPPPPPAGQPSYTNYPPQNYMQSQQGLQPTPDFAKPQKNSSGRVLGQIGFGFLLVILLILVICGASSYFAYNWIRGLAATNPSSSYTGSGSTSNGNNGSATNSIATTTKQLSGTVNYAGVDITFVNVQQGNSFTDDTSTANSPVVVRVNFKEHNPTAQEIFVSYSENARLILPDGTSVVPGNEQNGGSVNQAVTEANWIDFPLTKTVSLDQLTFQLGGQNEAQLVVPLTGNADLSAYQPKTITPNTAFQYGKMSWTITSVTSRLSDNGKQATKGMRYIIVSLKMNNTSGNEFIANTSDYVRLKSGDTTNSETKTDFPNSIAIGATATGTVSFLMPDNNNAFTLVMLPLSGYNTTSQVTTNFQM
ncbi:MAG: zinc ribbon domain-containing protein [Chloroflexota bacterium]|nr:zinc ribbon domain-containing protein [Chloroflexota bacterium]